MKCVKPVIRNNMWVRCGQCIACRITHASMWSLRLTHELPYWDRSSFITLTYNDENLPYNLYKTDTNSLYPPDVTNFWKKLRKRITLKFKYYLSGEYGDETERPHYHAILFGLDGRHKQDMIESWGMCEEERLTVSNVTDSRINYVTSYVLKKITGKQAEDFYAGRYPPFLRCSGGIGWKWAEKNMSYLLRTYQIRRNGKSMPIPKYYVDKIHMEPYTKVHPEKVKFVESIYSNIYNDNDKKRFNQWNRELKQRERNLLALNDIKERKGGAKKV